jgi:TetR/AcrR family transcriptional regulator, regulator of cefoperazone and chloramphenicol sensitivity
MTEPKSSSSGYQRGEEARRRLIEAGIEVFGLYGYEAASTRMIADRAEVNLASIPYYFGNKEGLYQAVAEYIATHIGEPSAIALMRRVEAALNDPQLPKEQALSLLHELFDGFITTLLDNDTPELWTRFVFRELMTSTSIFDILNTQVVQKTILPCASLIGRILDKPKDDPECLVRAFSLFGQVLIFKTVREASLKNLGWQEFSGDRLNLVRSIIQQQVDSALNSPLHSSPNSYTI